ncbi:hypothetical protein Tco_1282493 [Tanacetum coccineum]
MPIFKRTFSQDLDLLEQHLTKDILSRTDCTTTLTDLRTKFENAFHSEFEEQSIRTDSTVQDDSSRSGNDTDADDADIRPIYDEEPMAEVQLTAECNIFAIGQQHTEQPEIIVEGRVDQSKTKEQTTSLLANNAELKAQIQEKVFAIAALKNDLRKLKGNYLSTEVHQAAETITMSNELDLLFSPLFDEYLNGENQVVLKSSAVTTADASDKRQQQPDSTSYTSTLATTVTATGNFDL